MRSSILVVHHGRQIGRLLAEAALSTMVEGRRRMNRMLGGIVSIDDIVLILTLLRDHPRIRPWTSASDRAADAPCSMGPSINGLAESLHRPFETMRRHIHNLADAGVLTASSEGVRLSRGFETGEASNELIACMHDGALRLLEDLEACGLEESMIADGSPYQADCVASLGIEICLIPFEVEQPLFPSWVEMAIVHAIAAMGVRTVTDDVVLSHRFASEEVAPPPSDLRIPVQPAEVARAIEIPVSTVHRQILSAGRDGKLERMNGGVMITRSLLEDPAFQNARRIMVELCLLSLSRFRMRGIDYRGARDRYFGPRPRRVGDPS